MDKGYRHRETGRDANTSGWNVEAATVSRGPVPGTSMNTI